MWPSVTHAAYIHNKINSHDISKMIKPTTMSTIINETISMHIEECKASELRRQRITAQSPRFSRWMQKGNEFGSNPSLGPSLSCAFTPRLLLVRSITFILWSQTQKADSLTTRFNLIKKTILNYCSTF